MRYLHFSHASDARRPLGPRLQERCGYWAVKPCCAVDRADLVVYGHGSTGGLYWHGCVSSLLPLHLSMMQDVLPRTPLGDVNCNPLPGDPPIAGWHRLSPHACLGWWFSDISIGMLHDCCELSCLGACWTFASRNTCLAALLWPFLLQKHEHVLVWTKVFSNLCWQFPWLVFQAHPECHRAELHHLLFNCFFLILHRYQFVITANSYCKSLLHPLCMFYGFSFGYLCFCSSISFCCCTKVGSHGLTML